MSNVKRVVSAVALGSLMVVVAGCSSEKPASPTTTKVDQNLEKKAPPPKRADAIPDTIK